MPEPASPRARRGGASLLTALVLLSACGESPTAAAERSLLDVTYSGAEEGRLRLETRSEILPDGEPRGDDYVVALASSGMDGPVSLRAQERRSLPTSRKTRALDLELSARSVGTYRALPVCDVTCTKSLYGFLVTAADRFQGYVFMEGAVEITSSTAHRLAGTIEVTGYPPTADGQSADRSRPLRISGRFDVRVHDRSRAAALLPP